MTAHDVLTEFRRQEILDAVGKVARSVGFEHLTMDKVAEEAGIAKGTIYKYFTDKDDLLHALLTLSFEDVIIKTEEVVDSDGTTRDLILEFSSILEDFSSSHRELILQLHQSNFKEKHEECETEIMTTLIVSCENILKKGVERGDLRVVNTQKTSLLFFGMLHHAFFADLHCTHLNEEISIEFVVDVFLNGIIEKGEDK